MDQPILLILICCFLAVNLILLLVLLFRRPPRTGSVALRDELDRVLRGNEKAQVLMRQEILSQFKNLNQLSLAAISQIASNTGRDLENMRATLDRRLAYIQQENEKSLSGMRDTVDKKLSETLSSGLNTSFESVGKQLEQVYRSMGEMRSMAEEIVDLKHILSNVKNRGTWGEVQLGSLISDILSPYQFEREFRLGDSAEKVDYAIKLPSEGDQPIYLPVDSKFPMDRYTTVLLAEENGDAREIENARNSLLRAIEAEAKKIAGKYILPPSTTDFAVLFVPSESLYCLLAASDMVFSLQSKQRVLLCGPSTFSALLNSLQVGFRSIAIQQQSGEILRLLSTVKKSFGALNESLDTVRRNLNTAAGNLEKASSNSRTIERKLSGLEEVDAPISSDPSPSQ